MHWGAKALMSSWKAAGQILLLTIKFYYHYLVLVKSWLVCSNVLNDTVHESLLDYSCKYTEVKKRG